MYEEHGYNNKCFCKSSAIMFRCLNFHNNYYDIFMFSSIHFIENRIHFTTCMSTNMENIYLDIIIS